MPTDRTALVTGATAGIGHAIAEHLLQAGWRVIITGRRAERLEAMEREWAGRGDILPLTFDVRDEAGVKTALDKRPAAWQEIDLLVNNAGLARGLAPIDQGETADWDEMIDTNVKGLLYVTRHIAPAMRERGSGQIINVGSTAAKEVYPNGGVYCASKHAVQAITDGLRMDMLGSGVKVSAIHPALTQTEFSEVRFHGDSARAEHVYQGYTPLSGADIANCVLWMTEQPAHVTIADMVVMPTDQASSTMVHRRQS